MSTRSAFSAAAVDKLLRLSALELPDAERPGVEADLRKIIDLIDALQAVDTSGVAPLAHPLAASQPLRADEATERVERDRYQSGAPAVRDGLYLVPRVLE